jgi:7,8-dihydroneopterin aldolase/epimerase/oxygenase
MGKIKLNEMEFYAVHGVPDAERKIRQLYIINICIEYNFDEAAKNDDINKTLNYVEIYKICKHLMQKKFMLIETLAFKIAHTIKSNFAEIIKIEVSVKKPQVQLKGKIESAEVIYSI